MNQLFFIYLLKMKFLLLMSSLSYKLQVSTFCSFVEFTVVDKSFEAGHTVHLKLFSLKSLRNNGNTSIWFWFWSLPMMTDCSLPAADRYYCAGAAEAVSRSNLSLGNVTFCPTEKGTTLRYHVFCSKTLHYLFNRKSSYVTVTRYTQHQHADSAIRQHTCQPRQHRKSNPI